MAKKATTAAGAALLILFCTGGIVRASDTGAEVVIVNSISPAPNTMFSPEIYRMAASAAPAPQKTVYAASTSGLNLDARRIFGGYIRAEKTERAVFTASLATMTALNVVDYISTVRALKIPGLREGNPLMKPFVKNQAVFAAVKLGTTALSVWGMNSLWKKNKALAWVLTTASNFALSYVVANNFRLIQRAK